VQEACFILGAYIMGLSLCVVNTILSINFAVAKEYSYKACGIKKSTKKQV
jgi:hypothetical protein